MIKDYKLFTVLRLKLLKKRKDLKKVFKEFFKKEIDARCSDFRKAYQMPDISKVPTFSEIFGNSNQSTQDLTKAINPLILNIIYGFLKLYKNEDTKNEKDGSDLLYHDNEIEIKVTHANSDHIINAWTGNRNSKKVPLHILIGYTTNETTIDSLFIGLINLNLTKDSTFWSFGKDAGNSHYASLKINSKDFQKIHTLIGSRKESNRASKYQQFLTEKL